MDSPQQVLIAARDLLTERGLGEMYEGDGSDFAPVGSVSLRGALYKVHGPHGGRWLACEPCQTAHEAIRRVLYALHQPVQLDCFAAGVGNEDRKGPNRTVEEVCLVLEVAAGERGLRDVAWLDSYDGWVVPPYSVLR